MKLLSALDALFLHLETPEQPMHVGALNTLILPPDYEGEFYEQIRRAWTSRLHLAPVFHRKLATMPLGITNPAWVIEEKIDLDWHVQRVTLARPGSQKQLNAAVAKAHAELLPRDRPLWRAYVFEGLSSGEVGFYAKFHHAALDGQGGVALAKAILDLEPNPPPRPGETALPAPGKAAGKATGKAAASAGKQASAASRKSASTASPARVPVSEHPSASALLAASFRGLMGQYSALVRSAPQLGSSISEVLGQRMKSDHPGEGLLDKLREALKGGITEGIKGGIKSGLLGGGNLVESVKGLVGPKTSINVAISNKRAFATLTLPLSEVKAIGKAAGGSLNDAVLGIISGGMRSYFKSHDALPKKPLICAMPVSLRSEPHKSAKEIENQSSMVLTTLATNVSDPVRRLKTIIEGTQRAKQVSSAMKTGMPTDLPSLGIPWLMTGLTKLYTGSKLANRLPPLANLTVSNVPGPPIPLYMAGAQITSYYPLSIVVHGIALNITLESYNGRLDFGLVACAKAMPDVSQLATFLEDAFEELKVHLIKEVQSAPVPAPAVKKVIKKAKASSAEQTRPKRRAKPA